MPDGMDPSLEERIDRLLGDTEELLGVRIAVHDHLGVLEQTPLRYRHFHRHDFCQAGRYVQPSFDRSCQEHCRHRLPAELGRSAEPMVHTCWKGGAEACVAVHRDGVHALTLFAGVRRAGASPPAGLPALAVRAWRTLPPPDPALLARIGRVLQALGHAILAEVAADRAPLGSRRSAIEACLELGVERPLAMAEVARRLGLSASRAAHLVTSLFGKPFGELLQERRLARARHLLATTDLAAAAIARRCGFADPHWFARVFTRQHGLPPGRWRTANRAGA